MTFPDYITKKIIHKNDIESYLENIGDKKTVFTNGCFDLIHPGHIHLLSKAKSFGDLLIVGLNADTSVKKLKGENRPIKDEFSRAITLAAFSFVDVVILFTEETPLELIELVKPNILVKGNDYQAHEIVGADFVQKSGGTIKTIPLLEGYSTSGYVNKL